MVRAERKARNEGKTDARLGDNFVAFFAPGRVCGGPGAREEGPRSGVSSFPSLPHHS